MATLAGLIENIYLEHNDYVLANQEAFYIQLAQNLKYHSKVADGLC